MLRAGASAAKIDPKKPQFLFGYPHVERYHTGVHDSLFTSALFLDDGNVQTMFISNDLIYVGKNFVKTVRSSIYRKTGIPEGNIMVTATHTHSGPNTTFTASNKGDPIVPDIDLEYLDFVGEVMVSNACKAWEAAVPASAGFVRADSTGIGTNRRDPKGPANHEVPVLLVREKGTEKNLACMLVVSMHPTILHEDSKLISSDFIGSARDYLKANGLGDSCIILTHNGPSGNLSPRHVTGENTFAEAKRIGKILGTSVMKSLALVKMTEDLPLTVNRDFLNALPRKIFPPLKQALSHLDTQREKFDRMKREKYPSSEIRTVECDVFGAEETMTLSRLQDSGELEAFYQACLPSEIQLIGVGPWKFVGWSGEVFVEYALAVKVHCKDAFVISLANGETQGYIVTEEAVQEGGYEANNSLFTYKAGDMFVEKTLRMCK